MLLPRAQNFVEEALDPALIPGLVRESPDLKDIMSRYPRRAWRGAVCFCAAARTACDKHETEPRVHDVPAARNVK
jgi:hypothetical protein